MKFKSHIRISHEGFLINPEVTNIFCSFLHYVDLSSKMLHSDLVIFGLSLSIFGKGIPLNVYAFGIRSYVTEFREVSASFLNATLTV